MDRSKPALVLYFLSSLVYVLSVALHWDNAITFLFKPMIVPAILFYFWQESRGRIGILPFLFFFFFYVGDMLILIEFDDLLVPLMLLNLISYLILGYYLTLDVLKIKRPEITAYSIAIVFIVFFFLLCLLYVALQMVFNEEHSNYFLLVFYAFTLVLLGILTTVFYVVKSNAAGFNLIIAMICLVICDLFYVLYNHYLALEAFININVFCQVVSLYFLVKYFLLRKDVNNSTNVYERL